MNAKGVAPVNSTYGTLIDAYSKGGLKEEALAWLQRMQSQGMEPDEVTMGIVVPTFTTTLREILITYTLLQAYKVSLYVALTRHKFLQTKRCGTKELKLQNSNILD